MRGHAAPNTFLVRDSRLGLERILAEAKRWRVADDVGVRMMPTGGVRLLASTDRARQFLEYVAAAESGAAELEAATVDDSVPCESHWDRILTLADSVARSGALGHGIDGEGALRLARAVRALRPVDADSEQAHAPKRVQAALLSASSAGSAVAPSRTFTVVGAGTGRAITSL